MWHRIVRWLGRRSLRWFYRDVVVVGAERIPAAGPVVLVANHPNDLPDVLTGFLSTPRPVHWIATISAATNPLARATYRGLGVIPVTRVRDARKLLEQGAPIADVNRVAYRRVVEALREGRLIGVFPEGGVNTGHDLELPRPGVGQMVLQCLDAGATQSLTIVPMGLQYEGRDTPFSDCCAIVGRPMTVEASQLKQSPNRLQQLNRQIFEALTAVTRRGATDAERAVVDEQAAAIGASLANSVDDGLPTAARVAPLLAPLASAVASFASDDAQSAADLASDSVELADLVQALGGERTSARDHAVLRWAAARGTRAGSAVPPLKDEFGTAQPEISSRPGEALRLQDGNLPLLILLSPLALFGALLHGPVLASIWRFARRTAESPAHRVARAYLPGIYIVLCWYLVLAVLAAVVLSLSGVTPLLSLLFFMLLFRLGDLTVKWRHGVAAHLFRQRALRLPVERLENVRERFDRIRDKWQQSAAGAAQAMDGRSVRVLT